MNERPDTQQIKAELAGKILRLLDERKLAGSAARELVGLSEAEISRLRLAQLNDLSIDRLIDVLNALSHRVDVTVRPATAGNSLLRMIRRMEELNAGIPSEEFEKVPPDLAQNLDHYLYGAKKTD
jgi:predicted XRE-type DNA-binding protein